MDVGYFSSTIWKNNGLVIHGGVKSPLSQDPSNNLILLSPKSKFDYGKIKVLDSRGPSLSHHASCIVSNADNQCVLLLIGGWNGHVRTSKVHAFNLETNVWLNLSENPNGAHRVDPPVGLSGHTATKIHSGLICVIGREGGVKTQRRFGQMFLLHLDLRTNAYWFTESPVLPQSRSGHTALMAPPRPMSSVCELLVFGGRDTEKMLICGKWESGLVDQVPTSDIKATENLGQMAMKSLPRMIGLRYHAMIVLSPDCSVVHGGRHFKAMTGKDVNGHFFVCHLNKAEESWKQIVTPVIPRFGHTLVLHEGCIYIIGGFARESDKNVAPIEKLMLSDAGNGR